MRRNQVEEAVAGFNDPALDTIREQARAATVARRNVFVARMSLPAAVDGDVQPWAAAIHQVEQNGWRLGEWSVCPEPQGPVAYAVFRKA